MATAGNAGGALAANAARAGLQAHVFVPEEAPVVCRLEGPLHGVDGLIDKAGEEMSGQRGEWFVSSTLAIAEPG